ncbi:hypothetical protein EYZ11_010195 [Aspergillus tanneri]|uniref:Uncharacterized protein n=1 Tax=Aspergillus tanneri TaxID=1220188 RepID=A0A4S3J6G8_9EURO|nr:hypothetical protein EYZ11_010195 [Aspergillus tanneri]
MASGTISAMNTGENVTIGGLCIQLLFFGVFIIVSIIFHRRIRKFPTQNSVMDTTSGRLWPNNNNNNNTSWEFVMWGLYISSVLILVRSIFRLVEYAQGNDGYLISHEAFMRDYAAVRT